MSREGGARVSSLLDWAASDLVPGTAAGDYIVGGLIARGGCGAVYHATHRKEGGHFALKALHARLAALPKMVERFFREIELVSFLRHPNVVEIRDVGMICDDRPFYVMEYLHGRPLDEVLRQRGRLSPDEALGVLDPVCAALAAAHAAGIVHRDVKASNIHIPEPRPGGPAGAIKLLDFGIAKLLSPDPSYLALTSAGRPPGTPNIMAPEQILGGAVDARTDVYALGVLAYRLLTGRPPFEGHTPEELAGQHMDQPAPRPSRSAPVGESVDAVVLRCLEKKPPARFDSVRSFISAFAAAIRRPSGAWATLRPEPRLGVAIFLDVRMDSADDDVDDALSVDMGHVLDVTEDRLTREGFLIAQATGNGVLGVRPLSDALGASEGERRSALALATSLHDELARRPTADRRVHANLTVHVGEVLVQAMGAPEILGGALTCTWTWAPEDRRPGVFATPDALDGLADGATLSDHV
jgi:serine/threonine protein kinase